MTGKSPSGLFKDFSTGSEIWTHRVALVLVAIRNIVLISLFLGFLAGFLYAAFLRRSQYLASGHRQHPGTWPLDAVHDRSADGVQRRWTNPAPAGRPDRHLDRFRLGHRLDRDTPSSAP